MSKQVKVGKMVLTPVVMVDAINELVGKIKEQVIPGSMGHAVTTGFVTKAGVSTDLPEIQAAIQAAGSTAEEITGFTVYKDGFYIVTPNQEPLVQGSMQSRTGW